MSNVFVNTNYCLYTSDNIDYNEKSGGLQLVANNDCEHVVLC